MAESHGRAFATAPEKHPELDGSNSMDMPMSITSARAGKASTSRGGALARKRAVRGARVRLSDGASNLSVPQWMRAPLLPMCAWSRALNREQRFGARLRSKGSSGRGAHWPGDRPRRGEDICARSVRGGASVPPPSSGQEAAGRWAASRGTSAFLGSVPNLLLYSLYRGFVTLPTRDRNLE